MNRMIPVVALSTALVSLSGCDHPTADGPPSIRLGDSVCAQCNMIISSESWATATIVEGPRGPEPRLFDDFNCQVNFEVENPDAIILARWSHCYTTSKWIPTESAHFLMSSELRAPMGSQVAAFSSRSHADETQTSLTGNVMTFEVAWKRLGFAGACCHNESEENQTGEKEHHDASQDH